jgi:predicted alpha/beta-fold hydrolase
MPVIRSQFHPPWLLRNPHLQTVLPFFSRRQSGVFYQRERLELPDGDFLDLDWLVAPRSEHVAILCHGLEGSSRDITICGMARALERNEWSVLAWNYRGCGGEINRLPRLYHSGETGDLALVVNYAARRFARLALVGFSLGGNLVLKYLGEASPHPAVAGSVALSAPVNLAASVRALDRRLDNRIYLRRLVGSLIRKVRAKARQFPERFDTALVKGIHGLADFDNRFTAPVHGFRDADDYWTRCSSRQFLSAISIPTLILNAQDDPFLTEDCLPFAEAEANSRLFLEVPRNGGHLGFLETPASTPTWAERRVVQFLARQAAG